MSFNGSGTFLINSAGQPVVTNTTISSTAQNALTADLATGLSTCITKNGQTTITANIPMSTFKLTGLGAGSAAGNSLRYEQLFVATEVTLLGAIGFKKGADIASAATLDLSTATGNLVHITGTTTITAVTLNTGQYRQVIFDGILTLTHHATNNNLPGAANIITAAGDRAVYWSDGTTVYVTEYQRASGAALTVPTNPRGYIDGCKIANGTDTTNDINVSAGQCLDSTNTVIITVATMAGKQLDANWAPGANAGMRNSGAGIANTTYHIYAVAKVDGTQDIYAHTSTTVATVITALQAESGGASYVYARRIASIVRSGATILQFVQNGDYFEWVTTIVDFTATAPGTAAVSKTLTVPIGIIVRALMNLHTNCGAGAIPNFYVSSLAQTDESPSVTINTLMLAFASDFASCYAEVTTNTSGQIRTRVSASDANVVISGQTLGWIDARGRNS